MGYNLRKEILTIEKYVAGKPISEVKREFGLEEVIKLASNENPLGCSSKAKEAILELVQYTALYPDAASFELKKTLAEKYGVKPANIFCGAGSDSLIRVIAETFISEGDESIMAEVTFPRYETTTKLMGGVCVKIPMKNNGLDLEAMVDAITDKTKVIWFCNPNNPTGNIFTKSDFEKVISRIPSNVIIVMDEAYIEYVSSKDFPNSLELIPKYENMIVLRTFSKAYGLASLRCGYGIASEEMVDYLNRVINSFDVNLYAQTAAIEALKDEEFLNEVVKVNDEGKEYLYDEFEKIGFDYIKTHANFIMVNTHRDDKALFQQLLKRGIIVRPGHLLGMNGWMRITIGTMEQNRRLVSILKEIL